MDICETCELEPTLEKSEMDRKTIRGNECLVCPTCDSVIDNKDADRLGGVTF